MPPELFKRVQVLNAQLYAPDVADSLRKALDKDMDEPLSFPDLERLHTLHQMKSSAPPQDKKKKGKSGGMNAGYFKGPQAPFRGAGRGGRGGYGGGYPQGAGRGGV